MSRFAKLVDDQSEIEKQDVDSTKKGDFSGPRYVLRNYEWNFCYVIVFHE